MPPGSARSGPEFPQGSAGAKAGRSRRRPDTQENARRQTGSRTATRCSPPTPPPRRRTTARPATATTARSVSADVSCGFHHDHQPVQDPEVPQEIRERHDRGGLVRHDIQQVGRDGNPRDDGGGQDGRDQAGDGDATRVGVYGSGQSAEPGFQHQSDGFRAIVVLLTPGRSTAPRGQRCGAPVASAPKHADATRAPGRDGTVGCPGNVRISSNPTRASISRRTAGEKSYR